MRLSFLARHHLRRHAEDLLGRLSIDRECGPGFEISRHFDFHIEARADRDVRAIDGINRLRVRGPCCCEKDDEREERRNKSHEAISNVAGRGTGPVTRAADRTVHL